MPFGDRLQKLLEQHNMTVPELARRTGLNKNTLYSYMRRNTQKIDPAVLKALADALDEDIYSLLGVSNPNNTNKVFPHSALLPVRKKRIRKLGNIAAGKPIFADEDLDTYVPVEDDLECDFALEVVGDSMAPRFLEGDIVYFREQPDVNDSQIAAVIIDDTATLKHVYHIQNGIQLVSDNPKYPPMTFDSTNSSFVRILGLAVGYYRKLHQGI